MDVRLSLDYEDVHHLFDEFDNSLCALTAFTSLLDLSLYQGGGDLKPDSYGISRLADQQIAVLREIRQALQREIRALESQKPEAISTGPATKKDRQDFIFRRILDGLEIADVASATHLPEQSVEDVLRAMVDFQPGERMAPAAPTAAPASEQDQKAATVERVLEEAAKPAEPATKRTGTKG